VGAGGAAAANLTSVDTAAAAAAAASTVQVTAVADTAAAPPVTGTIEVSVPLSCCIGGTNILAWARSRVGVAPASICFKPKVPGIASTKVCSTNHGFWNRGPMPLGRMWVVPQPPANVRPATCNRPGGFKVGDVMAECIPQGGRLPDLMNITIVTSKFNDPRRRSFIFSCDPPGTPAGSGGCTTR
jgi:hypothetical protein